MTYRYYGAAPDVGAFEIMPTNVKGETGLELPHFNLRQNYPNPFNHSTLIRYELPRAGNVDLTIYNLVGGEMETLVKTHQAAGKHEIQWLAKGLSSGIYLCKLQADEYSETKKL